MEAYLSHYGYHFSKRMAEWAISKMRDRNGKPVQMRDKETVERILRDNNAVVENNVGYDAVYAFHMAMSDYYGSSLVTEAALAKYVQDTLDDRDGYDGMVFTRFFADCNGKGIPIIWADMI